jgi:hypothetical protein
MRKNKVKFGDNLASQLMGKKPDSGVEYPFSGFFVILTKYQALRAACLTINDIGVFCFPFPE